jgi:hypothetical protein
MSSLSQAPRLRDVSSPHGAFQEHAAHVARWPATLSSKDSLGICIPKVLRHSYIALSRRTDNGHYVNQVGPGRAGVTRMPRHGRYLDVVVF